MHVKVLARKTSDFLGVQDVLYNRNKLHVISLTSPEHNTSYTMFDWTFLEVSLNVHLTFVQSITQTIRKLFVFWMYWMTLSQFKCCTETLRTFTANIWLHSFMSLNVCNEVMFGAEFLLTNVTREPSAFIVWLQQMCLELIRSSKTMWTVSIWVRLCITVNTNMTLQFKVNLKQHPTVRTFIRSTVPVYTTFMFLQAAGDTETLVTQWTLVRFLSRVDSHVSV